MSSEKPHLDPAKWIGGEDIIEGFVSQKDLEVTPFRDNSPRRSYSLHFRKTVAILERNETLTRNVKFRDDRNFQEPRHFRKE